MDAPVDAIADASADATGDVRVEILADAAGDSTGDAPGDASDTDAGLSPDVLASPCPPAMVQVGSFCVDTWEAYVVEVDDAGIEHPHSPYQVVDGLTVRAKTAGAVVPQGYVSQLQAAAACGNAGKRLCTGAEFRAACSGPDAGNYYPYGGQTDVPGYCNEGKGSMMPLLFGGDAASWTYAAFNDPRLNQIDGGLAPTGSFPHCDSPAGVFDCMGNLHEWGSDPADSNGHGRFRGGFYGDAELNGPGCLYVTTAHGLADHDYSTVCRCFTDAIAAAEDPLRIRSDPD